MSEQTTPAPRYVEAMPITEIVESKHNPRKHFDAAALKELEQSIREKGVLTPLLVRPNGKGHEIAAGHWRFRASKAAGLEAVLACEGGCGWVDKERTKCSACFQPKAKKGGKA